MLWDLTTALLTVHGDTLARSVLLERCSRCGRAGRHIVTRDAEPLPDNAIGTERRPDWQLSSGVRRASLTVPRRESR